MQEFLSILLQRDGHEVASCGSASEALLALESDDWDLVISDVRMPGMSGLELLDQVRQLAPETTVILITAHGTTESAVEAMKHGAYDYLTKPCSVDEIRLVVGKALEKRDLAHENQRLRLQLRDQSAIPTIVGKTPRMQEIFGLVRQVAPTRANFERELARVSLEYGLGVIPYSPLAAGFLTGKYRRGQPLPDSVRASGIESSRMNEQNWQIVDKLLEIAARHDTTATRVTLAWMLAQPFMTAPIIGANTTAQLEDSMGATELKLSPEEIAEISKVSDWERARTENEN